MKHLLRAMIATSLIGSVSVQAGIDPNVRKLVESIEERKPFETMEFLGNNVEEYLISKEAMKTLMIRPVYEQVLDYHKGKHCSAINKGQYRSHTVIYSTQPDGEGQDMSITVNPAYCTSSTDPRAEVKTLVNKCRPGANDADFISITSATRQYHDPYSVIIISEAQNEKIQSYDKETGVLSLGMPVSKVGLVPGNLILVEKDGVKLAGRVLNAVMDQPSKQLKVLLDESAAYDPELKAAIDADCRKL